MRETLSSSRQAKETERDTLGSQPRGKFGKVFKGREFPVTPFFVLQILFPGKRLRKKPGREGERKKQARQLGTLGGGEEGEQQQQDREEGGDEVTDPAKWGWQKIFTVRSAYAHVQYVKVSLRNNVGMCSAVHHGATQMERQRNFRRRKLKRF